MHAGKTHYAAVIASMSMMTRMTKNRAATPKELFNEMHSQWRIKNREDGEEMTSPVRRSLQAKKVPRNNQTTIRMGAVDSKVIAITAANMDTKRPIAGRKKKMHI